MSHFSKKIIAVLFAIWLPLFSGSALASSIIMQAPAGHCEDESMQMADMDMSSMDMGDMHAMSGYTDENAPTCNSCAVCHLACTAYLAVPSLSLHAVQVSARDFTPYLVSYLSVSSAPLLPPPLARI